MVAVPALLLSALPSSRAQEYVQITGEIETVTYQLGDTNQVESRNTISLVCTVGMNEWRIDNDFPIRAESKWFFDGTNVYHGVRPTKPMPEDLRDKVWKAGLATVPFEVAKSNLTIHIDTTVGGYPPGGVGVNIPWLTFCSGTYLKRAGRSIPLPVAHLRHAPDAFAYSDITETFEDELGLPRTVTLVVPESYKRFYRTDRTSDVQGNILKFHYTVTESTNFLGWTFPLKFDYVQNEPDTNGNWVLRYAGIGRVTSIARGAKPEGVFDPGMPQTVVDWRFRDDAKRVDGIMYPCTNAYAAPTNDPELQRIFAERVKRALGGSR